MTFRARIMACFPAFHFTCILVALSFFVVAPSGVHFLLIPAAVYALPLLIYRFHNLLIPLREGISDLALPEYSSWWGGHKCQILFIMFPSLEMIFTLVPGAFSLWLRLWGSHIGKNVYWTPRMELLDRGLLEIHDHVVVGFYVIFASHMIRPGPQGEVSLFVKRIIIGGQSLVGAGTRIGPGVEVPPKTVVPVQSVLAPRKVFGASKVVENEL